MSEKNGDKARFGRLRKQKIARRQATRDLRSRLLQAQQAKPAPQGPKAPPTTAPAKSVARPPLSERERGKAEPAHRQDQPKKSRSEQF